MERLRTLAKEESLLKSIASGALEPPDGVIRHRAREVARGDLDKTIESVQRERAEVERQLAAHERLCRTAHLFAASKIGGGWRDYLVGLCSLRHYADHTKADLRDAQASLGSVYHVTTATGTVSGENLSWLLSESRALFRLLVRVFEQADQLRLDIATAKLFGAASWQEELGALELPEPTEQMLGQWLSVVDSWIGHTAGTLENLRCAALDQLLISERTVAAHFLAGTVPEPAPTPSTTPSNYSVLLSGAERKREQRLDWWARFQLAQGRGPALARTAAALAIVGGVLVFGAIAGRATVVAYNGLARPVKVSVNGTSRSMPPGNREEFSLTTGKTYTIEARTADGQLIETFTEKLDEDSATYVYNVAGAAALGNYTIHYGEGAPPEERSSFNTSRWLSTRADFVLTDPPREIRVSSADNGSRVALEATVAFAENIEEWVPQPEQRSQVIATHARWDAADSPDILTWLKKAAGIESGARILEGRLSINPNEVVSLRTQQDIARNDQHREVCQRQTERARSFPDVGDLQYLAARCGATEDVRDQAYLEGWRKWPDNVWFAYAAGLVLAEQGSYRAALPALAVAWRGSPPLADNTALLAARFRRMVARNESADIRDLLRFSPRLRQLFQFETGERLEKDPRLAFTKLARGHMEEALAAAKGSEIETQILRLVAASDDAPPDAIRRALALPASGAKDFDAWLSGALAVRYGRDVAPYRQTIRDIGRGEMAWTKFMGAVFSSQVSTASEQLKKLPLELRFEAASFGVVALGAGAPNEWREMARYMLFASERPYFR